MKDDSGSGVSDKEVELKKTESFADKRRKENMKHERCVCER